MSARRGVSRAVWLGSLAAATAVVACVAAPALGDDAPTAEAAIEQARALVGQGHQEDAEAYLADLVREGEGPHEGSATVLLEAARLSTSVEDCKAYAARAIEKTRNSAVLEAAHMLLGDSYFAENLYLSASLEYEKAARHSSGRGPGAADLKRARSILASGDAGAAVETYREIADWGATPGEVSAVAGLGLGRALLEVGRPGEAAEQFETIARLHEETEIRAPALAGAAESHEVAGQHEDAVVALRRLIADCPDSYETVLARARLRTYALTDSLALPRADADTSGSADDAPEAPEQ